MSRALPPESWHLSLSIGKALWDELLGAALPFRVKDGQFDLARAAYSGLKQLQVKEKVTALLEDRNPPPVVLQARDRVAALWDGRRQDVYRIVDTLFHVEGDWTLDVDKQGTAFQYGDQKIGVDAHLKGVVTGRVLLLRRNVEIPFTLEKRIGASCALGDIRFDPQTQAITGTVQDPTVDLGDHVVLRLLNELAAWALAQQVQKFDKVPILRKAQVEELVSPAGGALRLQMGVQDVALEVNEGNLTLKVRFGFSQKQLEG